MSSLISNREVQEDTPCIFKHCSDHVYLGFSSTPPPPIVVFVPNRGLSYTIKSPEFPQTGYPPPEYHPPSSGLVYYSGMPEEGNPSSARRTRYTGISGADDDFIDDDKFSDQAIRIGFVRKVYSILLCQLLVTISIMTFCIYYEPARTFLRTNVWTVYVAMGLTLPFVIALACCGQVRRRFPINLILLGIFTLLEGYLLGAISSYHQIDTVLIAVGITTGIVLALTLFAFQTKWDFTGMGLVLLIILVVFVIFGIVAAFVQVAILSLIYASVGAVLFSFYLIYDTQLMLGGKHKYSLSPEEYIFAALNLYVDILQIFLMILTLVSGASRD